MIKFVLPGLAASLRLFVFALVLIWNTDGLAATLWQVDSRPGDPIAHGQDYLLDESDGTFTLQDDGEALYIRFLGSDEWNYTIRPKTGMQLRVGYHPNVLWIPTADNPAHDLVRNSQTCFINGLWYAIYELEYGIDGTVTSLAVDYDVQCESGSGQFGKIRVNSDVDLGDDNPTATAGNDQAVLESRNVTLDGSLSWVANGSILGYQWTQTAGTTAILSAPNAATTSFVAPDVSPGGDMLRFELAVETGTGKIATDTVTVRVNDSADELTALHHESEPDDYVGRGVEYYESSFDGTFSAFRHDFNQHVGITYDHDTDYNRRHSFEFIPPSGETLETGDYRLLGGYVSESNPGLYLSVGGNGCRDFVGRFVVYEVVYGTGQEVLSFAADYDARCSDDYDGGIRGQVRINSSLPVLSDIPWASAGNNRDAREGETIQLDATDSSIGFGQIVSYEWRQLSGPGVTLQNAQQAMASFLVPTSDIRAADMVFEVTVTSGSGKSDTAEAAIRVITKSDPQTSFSISSEPGDTVGNGQSFIRYGHQWRIQPTFAYLNGIWIDVDQPGQPGHWDVDFITANESEFVPGSYENAVGINVIASGRPKMTIVGDNRACDMNLLTGRFDIFDVAYKYSSIDRLYMNFEQRCRGGAPALFGSVRINYVDPSVPVAVVGRDVGVDFGAAASVDGSGSNDPGGSIAGYKWQQVAGLSVSIPAPNQPVLQFTAPSDIEAGSMQQHLAFELIVTDNEGFQNWAAVNVTVGGNASPIAENDELIVHMNTQGILDVLANDYDPNGDEIDTARVTVTTWPTRGTANVDNSSGAILYSPDVDYYGTDSIIYKIYDRAGLSSDTATAEIIVNSPPTATDDRATTTSGNAVSIPITGNDIDIDDFVDGDTITIVSQPTNGTVSPNAFGVLRYTPNSGFTGTDTFQYQVNDSRGGASNTATVTVTVTQPLAPPPISSGGGGGGGGAASGILIALLLFMFGLRRLRLRSASRRMALPRFLND